LINLPQLGIEGWPDPPAHLHFLGICGYAVSGLALACRELGYEVTGADEDSYPPTTTILSQAGVRFASSHDPANLSRWGWPDLVVLGNQVQPGNSELEAARSAGLPLLSEAEAQGRLAEGRPSAVVCGTHGKTTTASLTAWMLEGAGLKPGFRLGATSRDFNTAVRLGAFWEHSPFVFEGDEYTTSALDASAKFLHWKPEVMTLLNLELDHPDLYPDLEAYVAPYRQLVAAMPAAGRLLVNSSSSLGLELSREAPCRVISWGQDRGDWRILGKPLLEKGFQRLRVVAPDGRTTEMLLPIYGAHNASNALGALGTAVELGADLDLAARAASTYRGAARRFELLGEGSGIAVVDDYAHHPTKLRATIAGARQWAGDDTQLVLVHVPHTFSRTLALLPEYRHAFQGADLVVLGPIEPARERSLAHTVSSQDIADLVDGTEVVLVNSAAEAIEVVGRRVKAPAVVVCSSVRGWDGVARRVLERLQGQPDAVSATSGRAS
jgi:UDP-N-acetylmuramate: L-alanyl-gamma-D-glutamyl-meso-diaminopimelate ligase